MLHKKIGNIKDDEGGFTLIELLVVILIIGILAAVALPTFLNQGKKGADAAAQSDLSAIATKVEACATQTNDYTVCLPAVNASGKGSDADAPTLPATSGAATTVKSKDANGYVLLRTNTKGNSSYTITSTGGNVAGPVQGS